MFEHRFTQCRQHLHTPQQGTEQDISLNPPCHHLSNTLHCCPHLENKGHPTLLSTEWQVRPCTLRTQERLFPKVVSKRTVVACTKEQEEAQKWLLQPAWHTEPRHCPQRRAGCRDTARLLPLTGTSHLRSKRSTEYLHNDKTCLAQQPEIHNCNSSGILAF